MKYDLSTDIDKEIFKARVNQLYKKGAKVEITEKKPKRSVTSNALMWAWLNCIAMETGNDSQDLHEFFKGKFLGTKEIEINGEKVEVKPSTAKLDSKMFSLYLEELKHFASEELGVYLPTREDAVFNEFYFKYGG